jgi:Flp pilus assembly protein TadD
MDTGRGKSAAVAQPGKVRSQFDSFEQAMRLFHARKFREARDLFVQAAAGEERAIAHKAELHIRMCDRRLEEQPLELKTAEDRYNYGIAQINARNLADALQHLQSALALDSNGDHIYYALALCHGLNGDVQAAHDNLKRAIELQPKNRITARQDADFASIAGHPEIAQLLSPEKG